MTTTETQTAPARAECNGANDHAESLQREATLQNLIADSYGRCVEIQNEWFPLIDATIDFIRCNARFRNVLAVALRLAALPSRELEGLELAAKAAWRNAQDETRSLERLHGPLLPHPADSWPRPSWAKSRAA